MKANNFKTNIRKYNSAFAFASFGAQTTVPLGQIHGQIYHYTNTLHPSDEQTPVYGQLYIIEGEQAVSTRMAPEANQDCRADMMHDILTVMEKKQPTCKGI